MRNSSTGSPNGRWRLLVLDRSEIGDARWLIVTVEQPADVRPADALDDEPNELVHAWVAARHGSPVALTALPHAVCWRIDRTAPGS
jgi:hypothetical protein